MIHIVRSMTARAYLAFARLEWRAFWVLVLLHMSVTYAGLAIAGEADLLAPVTFAYFYATTVSTIGYGDLSPVTDAGRLFSAAWLFTGGLCIFTVFLAKVTQSATALWRKRMDGFGDFSAQPGLTVIVGLHANATQRIISDLVAGGLPLRDIVLVATEMPPFDTSNLHFVRCEDLVNAADLRRAGVASAKNVLVYADRDDVTLTAALAVAALTSRAHLVAAFECDTKAALLRAHTRVSPVVAQSPEVVSSEVLDPGISAFFTVLGSASTDVTAFAIEVDCRDLTADRAYGAFRRLGMTFLGTKCPETGAPRLNIPGETDLTGRPLYYIAAERANAGAFIEALKAERRAAHA